MSGIKKANVLGGNLMKRHLSLLSLGALVAAALPLSAATAADAPKLTHTKDEGDIHKLTPKM